MDTKFAILTIAVVSILTVLLRFLPFLIFGSKRQTPKSIEYLGKVLPFSIMAMLVVYCFRSVSVTSFPFGLPELIAGGAVALIHLWKRNTLLSIVIGTVLYMFLVQLIFA